jgi:hypothetical protein
METASLTADLAEPESPRVSWRLMLSLLIVPILADLCFWRQNPRLSVGLFALGVTGVVLLNRPALRWTRNVTLLTFLMAGAAAESMIDLCFSNVVVLLVLTIALAGETFYDPLRPGWSRCSETLWTLVKTPARWVFFGLAMFAGARRDKDSVSSGARTLLRVFWVALPGLVMTVFFALILGSGNALFAKLTNDWTAAIQRWIAQIDISFLRCFLWGFATWWALPLLWPSPAPGHERIWTRELPQFPGFTDPATDRLQSAIALGCLNLLFCFVNTIDVVYLWAGRKLPSGVTPSAFVHQGVDSLIVAVILSAILLALVFQQTPAVSRWLPLRLLGLLWIAQNLILLAGVTLRVKMYVEDFDLTLMRINLVFFLALVAAGLVLQAFALGRQKTLGWLLRSNLLAAFCLFYGIQFIDTPAIVADYNVSLWEKSGGSRALDINYLESLGAPAYAALQRVADGWDGGAAGDARVWLARERDQARNQLAHTPFASWQLRERACQRRLLAATRP